MTLDFTDWALKRKQSQIGTKTSGAKSVSVDVGGQVGKVQVFQSESNLLKQVVRVDGVPVYPIDPKAAASQSAWASQDESVRRGVAQKLVAALSEAVAKHSTAGWKEAPHGLSKVKATLRGATLRNALAAQQVEHFLPDAKYSLVLSSTYPSLLALSNQLVPYLLSGIAISIVSNAETSVQVAYLLDLLTEVGLPSGIFTQLIDFGVSNGGQIATFILLEDADVDSALDTALTTQFIYGIPTVKIFAQDSLKNAVQQVLSDKLRIEYPDNELFFENELFAHARAEGVKVNSDAVNFETDAAGLDVYYFRTAGEALKMVNHLVAPHLRPKWVSIWSEKSSLALRVAQGVQSSKQVAINAPGGGVNGSLLDGWHFELIAHTALARLVADNAELAPLGNKSWSTSVTTRVRTVHSALDSLKLTNGTAAAVRLALAKTAKEVDDDTSVNNTLWLAYYEPIGQIIVQLTDSQTTTADDTCLLSFGLNALIYGNSLVLVGKSATSPQFATWKKVQEYLDKQGFSGAVKTIASAKPITVPSTSQGVSLLVADNDDRAIQGVYIDQNQFSPELYSRLVRRIARSIAFSLSEYEMSKIVE